MTLKLRSLLRAAFYASPPSIYNYTRGLFRLRVTGRYASFAEASTLCPRVSWRDARYWNSRREDLKHMDRAPDGFLDPVALYYRGLLFGRDGDVRAVLDLGGGLGNIYRSAKLAQVDIAWDIVDVPEAVAYAKANGLETDRLRFSTSPSGEYDVALVSGTLQYLPDPMETIASLGAKTVILSNIPLADAARSYVAIQRSPYGRHPIWIFGRGELLPALRQRFSSVVEATHQDGLIIGFRQTRNITLICERK